MILVRHNAALPKLTIVQEMGAVVAVGNFDGVHLGHRKIVESARRLAQRMRIPLLALLFDPHPSEVLRPGTRLPLLMLPEERANKLQRLGVDEVLVLEFTLALSQRSALDFCQHWLKDWLKLQELCVGTDFHLGHQRQGDVTQLKLIGEKLGFGLTLVGAVESAGQPVSSSRIRNHLLAGEVKAAEELLGAAYALNGTVVTGKRLGATIGFPTANLKVPPRRLIPKSGVYGGTVNLDEKSYRAAVNIGVQPTLGESNESRIEAHLIDFQGELNGTELCIEFRHRLRDEQRFQDISQLRQAITQDILQIKRLIA